MTYYTSHVAIWSGKSAHNYTSCRYASNDDVMRKGRVQIMMIFFPFNYLGTSNFIKLFAWYYSTLLCTPDCGFREWLLHDFTHKRSLLFTWERSTWYIMWVPLTIVIASPRGGSWSVRTSNTNHLVKRVRSVRRHKVCTQWSLVW